ncbi:hypothetical protein [Agrobacterium tumefaciens]|uniref:hypothetical protein n=1 Tax=Agrobacterium tumefaciens TaxID=358 RepID=UPI002FD8F3C3
MTVDTAQQVVGRNVIIKAEVVEELRWSCLTSHHRSIPKSMRRLNHAYREKRIRFYIQSTKASKRTGFAMTQEKTTAMRRIVSLIKIVWSVSIIVAATAVGALIGWENHGVVGAVALGFVGLVVGGFLSSPSLLLQLIT